MAKYLLPNLDTVLKVIERDQKFDDNLCGFNWPTQGTNVPMENNSFFNHAWFKFGNLKKAILQKL